MIRGMWDVERQIHVVRAPLDMLAIQRVTCATGDGGRRRGMRMSAIIGNHRCYRTVEGSWRIDVMSRASLDAPLVGAIGMEHTRASAAVLATSIALAAMRRATAGAAISRTTIPVYAAALARLDQSLTMLDAAFALGDSAQLRRACRRARAAYERVRHFAEHYASSQVRAFDGVPMPQEENEESRTPLALTGLQMVESLLFPLIETLRRSEGRQLVRYMRAVVRTFGQSEDDSTLRDACIFDAMRQELARVSTLGTGGSEAAVNGGTMAESAQALTRVQDALLPYREELARRHIATLARLDAAFARAIACLRATPDVDRFDRLAFLTRHAIPAARALSSAQRVLAIDPTKNRRYRMIRDAAAPVTGGPTTSAVVGHGVAGYKLPDAVSPGVCGHLRACGRENPVHRKLKLTIE